MKRSLSYIIITFLALIVAYGGSGVSLMVYCCGVCQEQGMPAVEEHACCGESVHSHQEVGESEACLHAHSFPCGVTRISFDWTSSFSVLPTLTPVVIDLDSSFDIAASLTPSFQTKDVVSEHLSGPPLLHPRLYLSVLNQLLI